ncbi:MAG: hypothetical protein KIT58_03535 [Planctomycetota bacterium]|nr:hypothetical protein [Planctomycetota bacterium]
MSDRLLRDDERASRSMGHPVDQERLEARLLRAGQLDDLSQHLARAIGERRRAGSIWIGLEPAPGEGAPQRAGSDLMQAAQALFDDSCVSVTEAGVTEAVERLLHQSAGVDGEVMSRSDATELGRRLLILLGPASRARLRFVPRWEPVSPHNVRLERAGSLFGRTFEAGAPLQRGGNDWAALDR